MYAIGRGLENDFKEAAKWYQKAAEQNDRKAQANLAGLYYFGQGIEKDIVTSYAWWSIAASNGDFEARRLKATFTKDMTRAQVTKAAALIKELQKKIGGDLKAPSKPTLPSNPSFGPLKGESKAKSRKQEK